MSKSGINRSIFEILSLSKEERSSEYKAENIHKVFIDGNEYTNYGQYRFIWEKTYPTSPTRSLGGVVGGLNTMATFLVGHFYIDFSLMSIDDYRRIMQQHYSRNEFTVTCYDVIYDKSITLKMYFATEQVAKLRTIANNRLKSDGTWEDWVDLVGVEDYTVEMIGTNSSLDTVSVTYHLNPPTSTGLSDQIIGGTEDFIGSYFVMGKNTAYNYKEETFNNLYKFKCWETKNGTTTQYLDGATYQLNENLDFYAVWESSKVSTLNFSYGLAEPIKDSLGNATYSKQVQNGVAIGELPSFETPTVTIDNIEYRPYRFGSWYKTPIITENSEIVTSDTLYWSDYSSTIYLLFDKVKYRVEYVTNSFIRVNSMLLAYQDTLPLPELERDGYEFKGWYKVDLSNNKVDEQQWTSNSMPPYRLKLTAIWEEKND